MAGDHSRTVKDSQKKPLPPVKTEEEQLDTEKAAVETPGVEFAAGETAPTLQRVADRVRKTWGQEARQRSLTAIQRRLGNKAAAQVAAGASQETEVESVIQRHPEGAPLVPQAPQATADVEQARSGVPAPPAPSGVGGGTSPPGPAPAGPGTTPAVGGPTPAGPGAAPAGPSTGPAPAGPGATPSGPTTGPAPGPAPAGPAPAGPAPAAPAPTPAPAPVLGGTMSTAFAEEALNKAFGEVAGRDIIPGNITVTTDRAGLYAAYDQWCIDHGVTKSDGSAWQLGDKAAIDAAAGVRMNAFAEPSPGTNIWVDASGTDPTATVHEMLHINTEGGFRAAVGEIINEGVTQRLAVRAVQQAGESVVGSERTYQREQEVVQALVDIVGDGTVTSAYFGGAGTLISAYNTAIDDEDGWRVLKVLLDARDFATALTVLRDDAAQINIRKINVYLEGWVSSSDLAGIRSVYNSSSEPVKTAIRTAIEPRTHETFWRTSTRIKVREIIEAT